MPGQDFSSATRTVDDDSVRGHPHLEEDITSAEHTREKPYIASDLINHYTSDKEHLNQPSGPGEINPIFVRIVSESCRESLSEQNTQEDNGVDPEEEVSDMKTLVPSSTSSPRDRYHYRQKPGLSCCIIM